jgi:hypothetical protein
MTKTGSPEEQRKRPTLNAERSMFNYLNWTFGVGR